MDKALFVSCPLWFVFGGNPTADLVPFALGTMGICVPFLVSIVSLASLFLLSPVNYYK